MAVLVLVREVLLLARSVLRFDKGHTKTHKFRLGLPPQHAQHAGLAAQRIDLTPLYVSRSQGSVENNIHSQRKELAQGQTST